MSYTGRINDAGEYNDDYVRPEGMFEKLTPCPVPSCWRRYWYKWKMRDHLLKDHSLSLDPMRQIICIDGTHYMTAENLYNQFDINLNTPKETTMSNSSEILEARATSLLEEAARLRVKEEATEKLEAFLDACENDTTISFDRTYAEGNGQVYTFVALKVGEYWYLTNDARLAKRTSWVLAEWLVNRVSNMYIVTKWEAVEL
jgi:hypothetical protein